MMTDSRARTQSFWSVLKLLAISSPLAVIVVSLGVALPARGAEVPFTERVISTSADVAQSVFAADVDGDGNVDVLSASQLDGKIAWYESDGGSPPAFTVRVISTTAPLAVSVFATDLDGDGHTDVLSASRFDDKIAWYENDGGAPPTFFEHVISTAALQAHSVFAIDLDDDGDTDVLSASNLDDKIAWYENDGGSPPTFVEHVISTNADFAFSVFAIDIDGDGDIDVLSASRNDNKIAWYENNGLLDPSFTERVISTTALQALSVFAIDLDDDGDTDVLSASNLDDKIAWYENDGLTDPSFTERVIATPDNAYSVFAADVDGDGDIDVLSAAELDDEIAWYENDGLPDPAFTKRVISITANGARSVFATDLDGDGDIDVLSASATDDKIAWYENTTPLCEIAEVVKLIASDAAGNDRFGNAVAINGTVAVVCAANQENPGNTLGFGKAYVFEFVGGQWVEVAQLLPSDPETDKEFCSNVALGGDTIVVGAGQDGGGIQAGPGAAYVFVKPGIGWADMTQTAKLTASDRVVGQTDKFGQAVGICGDVIVIGALTNSDFGGSTGSAYVFENPSGGWVDMTETQKLLASDAAASDRFGSAVACDGNTIVIGADQHIAGIGKAFVFERLGDVWKELAMLTPSDGAAGDDFGAAVAIRGKTVAVGAFLDDEAGNNSGLAYVFEKPVGGWLDMTETAKLTASDGAAGDTLGISVAVNEDESVFVGAYADRSLSSAPGFAYLFGRPVGGWSSASSPINEIFKVIASDGASRDQFGASVSIDGNFAVVGASLNDDNGANSGSAYVFSITCEPTPFTSFDIERARVRLEEELDGDRFEVRGSFVLGETGDGIDVLNEDVTVIFDGFSETIPAGSFFRDDDDEGFQFDGLPGGITRVSIRDDGEFEVRAEGLDLSALDLANPVPFSLQIGDDIGETLIEFDDRGRFPGANPPEADMMRSAQETMAVNIKNRYLSIIDGNPGQQTALRVTVTTVAPQHPTSAPTFWIGPPMEISENGGSEAPLPGFPTFWAATFQCMPFYTDWSLHETLHVYHQAIVPDGHYAIQAIDRVWEIEFEDNYSDPLTLKMAQWGDVSGRFDNDASVWLSADNSVDVVTDVIAVIDKFAGRFGAPIKARADLYPATPDRVIDILDITAAVSAFRGEPYPFDAGSIPCP